MLLIEWTRGYRCSLEELDSRAQQVDHVSSVVLWHSPSSSETVSQHMLMLETAQKCATGCLGPNLACGSIYSLGLPHGRNHIETTAVFVDCRSTPRRLRVFFLSAGVPRIVEWVDELRLFNDKDRHMRIMFNRHP